MNKWKRNLRMLREGFWVYKTDSHGVFIITDKGGWLEAKLDDDGGPSIVYEAENMAEVREKITEYLKKVGEK